MLSPDQFRVNEAWIAIRANDSFLFVKDEPYDVYVLMDAASAYVFGPVLARVVDESPDEKDVENLFKKAWMAKRQWPLKIIIPEDFSAKQIFKMQAERNGLAFEIVSLSDLSPVIGPLKESFATDFIGKTT